MPAIHLILMPEYRDSELLPPLGIACLGAYLKKHGVSVTCSDFRLVFNDLIFPDDYVGEMTYSSEIPDLPIILSLVKNYKKRKFLLDGLDGVLLNQMQYRVLNYFEFKKKIEITHSIILQHTDDIVRHEIIGFTTISSNLLFTVMLSLVLRQRRPDIKIVYGGPQVTLSMKSAKLILKLGIADSIILGEGEEALLQTVRAYEQRKYLTGNGAMTYNRKKDILITGRFSRPVNLNTLPEPDFSIFQLEKYSPFCFPLYGSRGCIFKCRFCSYNKLGAYRLRNPSKVVNSMEYLRDQYNAFRFFFVDSALNIYPKWLWQVADELIKRKCNLQWAGFFKPWITQELLFKLRKSGLFQAMIGAESFSDSVLKRMGRNTDASKIIKTIELFCSVNIRVSIGILTGFPKETRSEFLYTYRSLLNLKEKYPENLSINPQMFQLRPSSECYERYYSYGLRVKRWDRKAINTLPEVSNIIREIPLAFFRKRPNAGETRDRLRQIESINPPLKYVNGLEKNYIKECLRRLGRKSLVEVIDRNNMRISKIKSYTQDCFFILLSPISRLFLTDREMFIFQYLTGLYTLSEIADRLSAQYDGDRKESYKSILQFIYYMLNHNILLQIRYSRASRCNEYLNNLPNKI